MKDQSFARVREREREPEQERKRCSERGSERTRGTCKRSTTIRFESAYCKLTATKRQKQGNFNQIAFVSVEYDCRLRPRYVLSDSPMNENSIDFSRYDHFHCIAQNQYVSPSNWIDHTTNGNDSGIQIKLVMHFQLFPSHCLAL